MPSNKRGWRVIAQRLLTNEFLHWNLPLSDPTTTRELSGPGGVFGTIDAQLLDVIADDGNPLLEPWSTALYVEDGGVLRGGGIVQSWSDSGPTRTLEAPGFASYPTGVPYVDYYQPTDYEDPITVFANLWSYVQSFADGNLGVTVNKSPNWLLLSDGEGPYTVLLEDWKDVGQELAGIAGAVPFDFIERHTWNSDHTAINHVIDTAFPRFGRRRDDLRFVQGENIDGYTTVAVDGQKFANDVYGLGNGSGRAMLTSRSAVRDGHLRRPAVVPFKSASQGYLDRLTRQERIARALQPDISELLVHDTPTVRIGALMPGDDVFVDVRGPRIGRLRTWLRVLAIQETGNAPGAAILKTQRSDSFNYMAAKSPDGEPMVVNL